MATASQSSNAGNAPAALPDLDLESFRSYGHEVIDWIADFLGSIEELPVMPPTRPGDVRALLPAAPPEQGEPMDRILADFRAMIVPNITQWNHPSFFAYFATTSTSAGILAEALAAALNNQAMLWRSGQASTELEQVTLDWLRQLIGLPDGFEGTINDTASTSTLYALAAARELHPELALRKHGLSGRDLPRMRVYCSQEAHTVTDKAVMTLGFGLDAVKRVAADANFRMDVAALKRAIEDDIAHGIKPLAVVATVGTTSTTAVDPVPAIADLCDQYGLWLHVDAAYGGAAAILPEMRWIMDGCERAHSFVVNPHKWLFIPLDCSVLYTRRPDLLRAAFSLNPPILVNRGQDEVRNLMDYGIALGRRFRSLKLWFVMRRIGAEGLRAALREHCRLARLFADWVDRDPAFERIAPVDFSTVVFRYAPPGVAGESALARLNAELVDRLNASGEVFLSHTVAGGRFVLRLAVGNLRTEERHVRHAWELLRSTAQGLQPVDV